MMKNVDLTNFLPIDKLKIYMNKNVSLHYGNETFSCHINPEKIPFEQIDELSVFDQERFIVTLERILNYSQFIESKYKEGFENIELSLGKIGDVFILR